MATKQEVVQILRTVQSATSGLDQKGTNDIVTMALMIGSVALDYVSAGRRLPIPSKLYSLAFHRFFEEMGHEPDLGSGVDEGPRDWSPRDLR